MLSTEDILEFQRVDEDDNDLIHPVLLSTFTSSHNEVGVEVIPIPPRAVTRQNQSRSKPRFNIVDPNDNEVWYQIKSDEKEHFLLKLEDNRNIWKHVINFTSQPTAACISKGTLIIALEDGSILFIDTDSGCYCIPTILIQGYIIYLKDIGDDCFVSVSSLKKVCIWKFETTAKIVKIFDQIYANEMSTIDKIEVTQEIIDGSLSPIIYFKENAVRWSNSRNFWVCHDFQVPFEFNKQYQYETIADIENEFSNALLYYDTDNLMAKFKDLIAFYVKSNDEKHSKKAFHLIIQLFLRIAEWFDAYCDVPITNLINEAVQLISDVNPGIYEQIKASEPYQAALKRKDTSEENKPRYIFKGKLSTYNLAEEEKPTTEYEPVLAERAKYSYTPNEQPHIRQFYNTYTPQMPIAQILKQIMGLHAQYLNNQALLKQAQSQFANDPAKLAQIIQTLNFQQSGVTQQYQYFMGLRNNYYERYRTMELNAIIDEYNRAPDNDSKRFILDSNPLLKARYNMMTQMKQGEMTQIEKKNDEDLFATQEDILGQDEHEQKDEDDVGAPQQPVVDENSILFARIPKKRGRPRKNPEAPPTPPKKPKMQIPTAPMQQVAPQIPTAPVQQAAPQITQKAEESVQQQQQAQTVPQQQTQQAQSVAQQQQMQQPQSVLLSPAQLQQYNQIVQYYAPYIQAIQKQIESNAPVTPDQKKMVEQYKLYYQALLNHYSMLQAMQNAQKQHQEMQAQQQQSYPIPQQVQQQQMQQVQQQQQMQQAQQQQNMQQIQQQQMQQVKQNMQQVQQNIQPQPMQQVQQPMQQQIQQNMQQVQQNMQQYQQLLTQTQKKTPKKTQTKRKASIQTNLNQFLQPKQTVKNEQNETEQKTTIDIPREENNEEQEEETKPKRGRKPKAKIDESKLRRSTRKRKQIKYSSESENDEKKSADEEEENQNEEETNEDEQKENPEKEIRVTASKEDEEEEEEQKEMKLDLFADDDPLM